MEHGRPWSDLSPEEKKQYFRDYYLVKVIIAAAVLLFGIIWIRDVLKPEPVYAMRIGLYDVSLDAEEKEDLAKDIAKALDTYDEVEIDDAYTSLNDEDLMRIVSRSETGGLDLVIASKDVFVYLAGYGYFKDLSLECSEEFLEASKDRLIVCAGLKTGEGGMLEEGAEGSGEPYTAGIAAAGTLFEPYLQEMQEPVIGVIYESERLPSFETLAEVLGKQ